MPIPLTESETDLNDGPASLQEVLGSRCFDRADTQKKVLIYLWSLRGKDVSEYGIATEALGRRPDFDPKIDASVRVQVSRLRKKLKEFYETEGRNAPYHLQIPIGSHSLEVVEQSPPSATVQSVPERVSWHAPRWAFIALSVLCVLFAALSIWSWSSNKRAAQFHDSRALNQPLPFWKQFLGTSSQSQIVLPTPVFVKFSANRSLRVRDIDVNDFQQWRSSPDLVAISQHAGEPRLEQGYTVASDTFAAIRLARYLDSVGLGKSLTFNNSSDASMSDLESSSEIVLGSHGTLHAFQPFLDKMSFVLTENESSVEERAPNRSATHEIFRAVDEGAGRTIEPGLIASLPGKDGRTQLLILQSRRTAALVEMMTSTTGAEMIDQLRKKKGNPRFFEVVVLAEMNGDHMIRAWPLDLAPVDPAKFGS